MSTIKSCKVIGSTSTTTQNSTEIISSTTYGANYNNYHPNVVGFSLFNRGSAQMDVQLNNGDVLTIEAGEGLQYSENVEIFSCKILTNGSIYQWEGILL